MARQVEIRCVVCKRLSMEVVHPGQHQPQVCSECQGIERQENKDEHLAGLKALPLEKRVARIEEWIYNYKPQHTHYDGRF